MVDLRLHRRSGRECPRAQRHPAGLRPGQPGARVHRPILSRSSLAGATAAGTGNLGSNLVLRSSGCRHPGPGVSVNIELAVLALLMRSHRIPVRIFGAYRPVAASTGSLGRRLRFDLVPSFLGGITSIMVLAIKLEALSAGPVGRPTARGWLTNLHYAFLPALTLAIPEAPSSPGCSAATVIGTLQEDLHPGRPGQRHANRPHPRPGGAAPSSFS